MPSFLIRHRPTVQILDNGYEEERNAIDEIQAELENSLSRLIEDHNRSDLLDENLLNLNSSPRGGVAPYLRRSVEVEDIQEIDEEDCYIPGIGDYVAEGEGGMFEEQMTAKNNNFFVNNSFARNMHRQEVKTQNSPEFKAGETAIVPLEAMYSNESKSNSENQDAPSLDF